MLAGWTVSYFEWIKNLSHIRFGRMQRRENYDRSSAIIQAVEMMTGKEFPNDLRAQALTGSTELHLVRSGLEDTMREAYAKISHEWNTNKDAKNMRVAGDENCH